MTQYHYKAFNTEGAALEGVIAAPGERQVAILLIGSAIGVIMIGIILAITSANDIAV